MKTFREQIIELGTNSSGLTDDKFNEQVLALVTAHVAESTREEDNYYTRLAMLELMSIASILRQVPSASPDPLAELRKNFLALQKNLKENIDSCIIKIKGKIEAEALKFDLMAKEHEERITAPVADGEEPLSEEKKLALGNDAKKLRERAASIRKSAQLQDGIQKELQNFIAGTANTLSLPARNVLAELRRQILANEGVPQTFAAWSSIVDTTSRQPKISSNVANAINVLLAQINKCQEAVEKTMRDATLERTALQHAQQTVAGVTRQATEEGAAKKVAEKKVLEEQREKNRLRDENRGLHDQIETMSRASKARGGFGGARSEAGGAMREPFNDFIGLLEFLSIERVLLVVALGIRLRKYENILLQSPAYEPALKAAKQMQGWINRLINKEAIATIEEEITAQNLQEALFMPSIKAAIIKNVSASEAIFLSAKDPELNEADQYEYHGWLKNLFADNGPYGFLPADSALSQKHQQAMLAIYPLLNQSFSDSAISARDPFNDLLGMLKFWSLERALLIVILMVELRKQQTYASAKMTRHINAAEHVKTITDTVKKLAEKELTPLDAIEVLSKLNTPSQRDNNRVVCLDAYTYVCRLVGVLQYHHKESDDPKFAPGCKHAGVHDYEFFTRLSSLFADNGPYSLLPFDALAASSYDGKIKQMSESSDHKNKNKTGWNQDVDARKAAAIQAGGRAIATELSLKRSIGKENATVLTSSQSSAHLGVVKSIVDDDAATATAAAAAASTSSTVLQMTAN